MVAHERILWTMPFLAFWATLLLISGTPPARGHGMEIQPVPVGQGLEARYTGGRAVPFAEVQVQGPEPGEVLHQRGFTDRDGRFAFVPNQPGLWVVIVDDGLGHRVRYTVDVTADWVVSPGPSPGHLVPWTRTAMGLSLLFGVFGGWSLIRTARPGRGRRLA